MSEIAATNGNDGDVERRPYQDLIHDLANLAELSSGDSFDIAANVIDLIMQAGSPEEIFAANESGPADVGEMLGEPIGILDCRFRKSAERYREGTLGYYVIFDYVDTQGEKKIASTGAPNVVASLRRFQRLNFIDGVQPLMIKIKGRETENGTLYTVAAP
jgi:hypothetical protein